MTQLRPLSASVLYIPLSLLALTCQSANAGGAVDVRVSEAGTTAVLITTTTTVASTSTSSEMTPRVLPHDTQDTAHPARSQSSLELRSGSITGSVTGSGSGSGGAHRCPEGMTFVEGRYCPDVEHTCLEWMDPPGSRYAQFRCARYASPAKCKGDRKTMRFCIETTEHRESNSELPMHKTSWTDASRICASSGARLCTSAEWQFACEGEAMHPYPYGSGFVRDKTACNIDRTDLGRPQSGLRDLRAPITAYPRCVSVFGVHGMSGNVEEWTALDGVMPPRDRSAMKGAWWLPGKNTCRAATLNHGEIYRGPQVGVRCCRDAG